MLTLAIAIPVLLTVTGCWSQYRNGPAHTGYNPYENILNTSNVSNLWYTWKGRTGGPIASSPAVAIESISGNNTGVVYVASTDGYLYAFDAGCANLSCLPIWRYQFNSALPHPYPTYSYSSPAVAAVVINGVETSVVYVTAFTDYHAYDGAYLYAIDAVKGTLIWVAGLYGTPNYSSPAVVNGVVYVMDGGLSGCMKAIDAATGTTLGCVGIVYSYSTSPAVANGILYAGDDSGNSQFRAFSTTLCGHFFCPPLWTSESLAYFRSSPAVANGAVYVGSDNGNLYAFDAAGHTNCTGTPVVCQPLWTGPTNGPVYSSPAVANGVVYVGSNDKNLYAFDANGCNAPTCSPLWTGPTGGAVVSSPAVANGVVYVGSTDGNLYAFDANGCNAPTCRALTKVPTHDGGGAYLASSPAVSTGWVYVGSSDGNLYALQLVDMSCCNIR